jgi:hypothetical protein
VHALVFGRQVLRDNTLALFPQRNGRLWTEMGVTMKPPAAAPIAKPQ